MLAHLAETRPHFLNPKPIDWQFVDKQCVNRFVFPPVLPEKIAGKNADALLRAMLHESREYVPREAGGPLKYAVVESTVARYNSLGVGPHLEAGDAGIRALDLDTSLTIVDALIGPSTDLQKSTTHTLPGSCETPARSHETPRR